MGQAYDFLWKITKNYIKNFEKFKILSEKYFYKAVVNYQEAFSLQVTSMFRYLRNCLHVTVLPTKRT